MAKEITAFKTGKRVFILSIINCYVNYVINISLLNKCKHMCYKWANM